MDVVVAIMAGGAGTRFWPASTTTKPKQFLALAGDRTLLQQSYDRAKALTDKILVVTNAAFVAIVREQLPALSPEDVVGEPERKDTAAAVVLATLLAEKRWPGSTLVVLTSDHVIGPLAAFVETMQAAVHAASLASSGSSAAHAGDALYTVGIPPTFPSTGFGYLKVSAVDGNKSAAAPLGASVVDVERFVEKPTLDVATGYVKSGDYLWNAGMFVWRARAALEQMQKHLPVHVEQLARAVNGLCSFADAFGAVPKISIDFGLMEKAARVRCVRATFAWSDVGSFPALAEHLAKDAANNAHRGRVVAHDAHDNVVWCESDGELVALVGVDDLVVVRAGNRTLVAKKSRAEEIKKLVDTLAPEDKD